MTRRVSSVIKARILRDGSDKLCEEKMTPLQLEATKREKSGQALKYPKEGLLTAKRGLWALHRPNRPEKAAVLCSSEDRQLYVMELKGCTGRYPIQKPVFAHNFWCFNLSITFVAFERS